MFTGTDFSDWRTYAAGALAAVLGLALSHTIRRLKNRR